MKRIGFIINSRVPAWSSLARGMRPPALLFGWDDAASPMSFMRFRWIAEALAAGSSELRYELYRPGRRYAAVVFLKSMGSQCLDLARRLRAQGTKVIFEANVDYYTHVAGEVSLDVMAPTPAQRAAALGITDFADGVIASSRHLTRVCAQVNPNAAWVPDNVNLQLAPKQPTGSGLRDGRLQVWWSGMAAKVFEFLAAEEAFLALADHIHLHLVTDDLDAARQRWPEAVRDRVDAFLRRVPHTCHRFTGVRALLDLYAAGGVIVSPRFLDVPYNLSHTEWKITLGMAVGLPAVASPVPSYRDVADVADPGAVVLADSSAAWHVALTDLLEYPERRREAGEAARAVVAARYATSVVAREHAGFVQRILNESGT